MPGDKAMGDVLNTLARLHDGVTRVGFHLSKLCLGIIVFAYCYEVFARYFFAAPTWWSSEAVQYSLCIGCFLMMPQVTREKGHVAVTVILDMFAGEKTRLLYWFIYLVGFLACAAATWISLDENIRQIVKDVHLMKVKPISQNLYLRLDHLRLRLLGDLLPEDARPEDSRRRETGKRDARLTMVWWGTLSGGLAILLAAFMTGAPIFIAFLVINIAGVLLVARPARLRHGRQLDLRDDQYRRAVGDSAVHPDGRVAVPLGLDRHPVRLGRQAGRQGARAAIRAVHRALDDFRRAVRGGDGPSRR